MTFRVVVFAAVSSRDQAGDEKASIPSQIQNARNVIRRREWQEVAEPLVVPGQSRNIVFLHEALAELPALAELITLARESKIDLVVVRDYDRLARTRALLAQLSTYLQHCGVQIYAIDKPVEPIPVAEIGRRRGLYSSATVEAFAGLEAEREVSRLTERRFFGVNSAMRKGKWIHSLTPYGYTRATHGASPSIPVPIEGEVSVIKRMERMYLEEGLGVQAIAQALNLEHIPSSNGKQWSTNMVRWVLRNPFYCGWIIWGLQRRQKVYDPKRGDLITRSTWVPAYVTLKAALGRRPGLADLLDNRDALEEDGVVIAQGQYEAIRTTETQMDIDREATTRKHAGGRAASINNPHVFTGLLRCGECGHAMTATCTPRQHVYYNCLGRRMGKIGCSQNKWIREEAVYEAVMGVLQEFARNPDHIDTYLDRLDMVDRSGLKKEVASLQTSLASLPRKRERWDQAYETGVIDLSEYSRHLLDITEEQKFLSDRILSVRAQLKADIRRDEQRQALQQAITSIPPLTKTNLGEIKLAMRRVIARITVLNARVVKIEFRDL